MRIKNNAYSMKMLGKSKGEIAIYGDIGEYWAEVTPKQFKTDLENIGEIDELDIRINSPGGEITAGYAMFNLLKSHKAKKTVYVDGIAASMGSILAMTGDIIKMSDAGMIMIHNPLGGCMGGSEELRRYADTLDKMKDTAAKIYSDRTGTDIEKIKELMNEETYLTAEEALEYGFIDEIIKYNEKPQIDPVNKMVMMDGKKIDYSKFPGQAILMNKFENLGLQQISIKNEEVKMTKAEMKEKHPDLYNEIYQEGVSEERARMHGIEELSIPGTEDFLSKYKFEEPKNAGEVSILMLKAIKNGDIKPLEASQEIKPATVAAGLTVAQTTGEALLAQKMKDAMQGNANNVPGSVGAVMTDEEKKEKEAKMKAERIAGLANQERGM